MNRPQDRLCVALDGSDRGWITEMAAELSPHVGWLKLGLEAFTAFGPGLVEATVQTGARVFLDLKLHDIPNTVERAAANCAATGAAMFNVHAAGGRAMLEAAVAGARRGAAGPAPLVLAVTVLTSLDRRAVAELGLGTDPAALVTRWARLARDAGLDGVVASAREAAAIRDACGPGFLIVTPGIRPSWSARADQRRVTTPSDGIAAGADVLVIGRPITGSGDPAAAVLRIVEDLAT
jgi:orotidine-5'-phosphate decarboxylase